MVHLQSKLLVPNEEVGMRVSSDSILEAGGR